MKIKPLNDRYEKHSRNLNKKYSYPETEFHSMALNMKQKIEMDNQHWMVSLVVADDGVHGRCQFKKSESR